MTLWLLTAVIQGVPGSLVRVKPTGSMMLAVLMLGKRPLSGLQGYLDCNPGFATPNGVSMLSLRARSEIARFVWTSLSVEDSNKCLLNQALLLAVGTLVLDLIVFRN